MKRNDTNMNTNATTQPSATKLDPAVAAEQARRLARKLVAIETEAKELLARFDFAPISAEEVLETISAGYHEFQCLANDADIAAVRAGQATPTPAAVNAQGRPPVSPTPAASQPAPVWSATVTIPIIPERRAAAELDTVLDHIRTLCPSGKESPAAEELKEVWTALDNAYERLRDIAGDLEYNVVTKHFEAATEAATGKAREGSVA